MKRSMDLIRSVLLAVEKLPPEGGYLTVEKNPPDGVYVSECTDAELRHHLRLALEAGLLTADLAMYEGTANETIYVGRLTWAGCEAVDAFRDAKRWKKALQRIGNAAGGVVFEVLEPV